MNIIIYFICVVHGMAKFFIWLLHQKKAKVIIVKQKPSSCFVNASLLRSLCIYCKSGMFKVKLFSWLPLFHKN